MSLLRREGFKKIESVSGPLIFIRGLSRPACGELVTVESPSGTRGGRILQIDGDISVIQVFEGTMGLTREGVTVWLERDSLKIPAGEGLTGRVFDGKGVPRDGLPADFAEEFIPVSSAPINPVRRTSPDVFVETGVSALDLMNTLVRGQKLPVFSGAGLPAAELAVQIVSGARIPGSNEPFLVVFAAMGITRREAQFFMDSFRESGALRNGVFYLNLAEDSTVERLLTPRSALAAAEYFAFKKGYNVLVVMTDMLAYCDALREVAAAREEVPGRRGYPGYMYSDLAEIYERAGCIAGAPGSVTQIPVITMPDDDMTHPVADLSGYITEGQIVLERRLQERGVYPPIDVLPCLSRLMNKGIGKGKTFPEHRSLADQLYASYARAREVERMRLIVGDDGLTDVERKYLEFGRIFETTFLNQGMGRRSLQQSEESSLNCLRILPSEELFRLPENYRAGKFDPEASRGAP
ncbi:MAG: V-type ATP synthase subunit B [Aminivibrio sp.]|nr:V-type ATP synthase subunit B [Synergistaceae bacterium]